jgi:hypothetical protein
MWNMHAPEERCIKALEEMYKFPAKDKEMAWTKGLTLSLRGSLYHKPMHKRGDDRWKVWLYMLSAL